jgi:hypothetical protein
VAKFFADQSHCQDLFFASREQIPSQYRDGSSMIWKGAGCYQLWCTAKSCLATVFEMLFTVRLSSFYYSNYCIVNCLSLIFGFIMKKNTPLPLRPLWPGLGDAYPLPPVNPSLNQYVGNWSVIQQSIVLKIIGICESYSKELNIEGIF